MSKLYKKNLLDILQIKKGEIKAKKKLKKKSNMTDEQWEKYINDILGLSINKKNNNIELPDDTHTKKIIKNNNTNFSKFISNSTVNKKMEIQETLSIKDEILIEKKIVKYIYPPEVLVNLINKNF